VYASSDINPFKGPSWDISVRLNLARQFLLVAFGVLLVGMFAMGSWVTRQIESAVVEVEGTSAALYINNFIAPHLQELATSASLSRSSIEALNRAMERPAILTYVTAIKIWKQDGLVVYSTDKDLIGHRFPGHPDLEKAWTGTVTTQFDNLIYEDDEKERESGQHLLEIYTPIRDAESGDVIAVLEFYERAETLNSELSMARRRTWMISALITIAMIAALYCIVANGSRTIDQQQAELARRVSQLSDLLRHNEGLRKRVERSSQKAAEEIERVMRRLGYDLHDGVTQLLGLSLLRLGRLTQNERDADNLSKIRKALTDAVKDIRNLCNGLVLPEIENLDLSEALHFMVQQHERKTGTSVACNIAELPSTSQDFVKTSLCRFVQEGLNNAFRHADGKGQRVTASCDGQNICVAVSDEGSGMGVSQEESTDVRLGLRALRDRIESIGGTMTVASAPGEGTRLIATLPMTSGESDE
jgi:signal transduction histidine kinase